MNPKVKQLAEQAGGMVLAGSEIEKFAELIVRECAGVGYDASYYECALNVSNKIKQHFGVEE